jgi:hypothetical protein
VPEVSEVTIDVQPTLPESSGAALPVSETLPQEAFAGIKTQYVSRYIFGGAGVDYGQVELYYIYVDTCEEIDRLNEGRDHDITMSFYPVLRAIELGGDAIKIDNVSDVSPEPRIKPVVTSRQSLLAQLVDIKRRIEGMLTS